MDRLPEHDKRYDMAEEFIEVVTRLWGSWDPGAIVADRASGVLIDHTKVHQIDYEGQYYRSRGAAELGAVPAGTAGDRAGGRVAARQKNSPPNTPTRSWRM